MKNANTNSPSENQRPGLNDKPMSQDTNSEMTTQDGTGDHTATKTTDKKPFSKVSIGSLVCGVVAILGLFGLSFVGIIMAAIGLKDTNDDKLRGRGFAIAGMVVSILALIVYISIKA